MESGPTFWLMLLTIGVIALGAAMVFGMRRNQARSRSDRLATDAATRRQYQAEDRNRS
jgi:Flp pilus assembly protein TadB